MWITLVATAATTLCFIPRVASQQPESQVDCSSAASGDDGSTEARGSCGTEYPQSPDGTFEERYLYPNDLGKVLWRGSDRQVSENAYEIGLDPAIRHTLLQYARHIGVLEYFERMMIENEHEQNDPDTKRGVSLHGYNWSVERPPADQQSDMHWISPRDGPAHDDFLRALSAGGFDEALEAIGKKFGFDNLVVYFLNFIAVTHCEKGYLHVDFPPVDGKAFNMIVPLQLVEGSPPELELQDDEDPAKVGKYKYRYDIAAMVGDGMSHGTAQCDYRDQKQMRVAATIYLADVNNSNINNVVKSFKDIKNLKKTEEENGKSSPVLPYSLRDRHWKKADPHKKLPGPTLVNDSLNDTALQRSSAHHPESVLPAGAVMPVTWKHRRWSVPNVYHVGIPPELGDALRAFGTKHGIFAALKEVVMDNDRTLSVDSDGKHLSLVDSDDDDDDDDWVLQRGDDFSDHHKIYPVNESSFFRLLRVLGRSGFDDVLAGIGNTLHLQSLTVYGMSFHGVHRYEAEHGPPNWSTKKYGPGVFEIIVPLLLVDKAEAETMIAVSDPTHRNRAYIRNTLGTAHMIGDGVTTCMTPHDHRLENKWRVWLSVRVADVTPLSASKVVSTMEQPRLTPSSNSGQPNLPVTTFPPKDPSKILQHFTGLHWSRSDPSRKLPQRSNSMTTHEDEILASNPSSLTALVGQWWSYLVGG